MTHRDSWKRMGKHLKWGEVYHMFKKSNFSIEAEEPDELKVFKNIRKSSIFRVASHPMYSHA
jgi:hypothetical protein